MDDVGLAKKSILVVGLERGVFRSIDTLLSRSHFTVDRVSLGDSGVALCQHVTFDLVMVKHPLADMTTPDFIAAVRRSGSASAHSQLLALAEESDLPELRQYIRGAFSTVMAVTQTAAVLEEVAGRLLKVAPRRSTRLIVRLRAQVDSGELLLMCQTENVSAAGMLVRTDRPLPLGTETQFQFTLPEDLEPLHGTGEVVRHTVPDVEKMVGIGLRFVELKGNSRIRLKAYLENLNRPA